MIPLTVNKDALRDQADILFNLADDLLSDQKEIVSLLHGAGNLLVKIWESLDDNYDVGITDGNAHDPKLEPEGDYDWALSEIEVLLRKRNGFLSSPRRGIYFIDKVEVEVDEGLIWDLLVEQSNFFQGAEDTGLIDVEAATEDDGKVFVIVEDSNYQVDDPEARRSFAMVRATPGLDSSGIDFEEL